MNFGEIFDQLKEKWVLSERYDLIARLEEAPLGAATGGEVMNLHAKFFLELKENDPNAFNEIENLADAFAKECAAYGTVIKGYNYKPYHRS